MQRSVDRILTTHAGSLPRPYRLVDIYREGGSPATLDVCLRASAAEVVRQQVETGLDVVNDGEFGKATRASVDYGAWWSYVYERLAGFEVREGNTLGRNYGPMHSKDRANFSEFYATGLAMAGGQGTGAQQPTATQRLAQLTCTGPVRYTGQALIKRDIENLKAALQDRRETGFMSAVSPATLQILTNQHYKNQEEYTWALADAIHEEYQAIVDAGLVLQIDDPAIVDLYDWWYSAQDDLAGYLKWAEFQVEVLNHALKGISPECVRLHVCWGSWHGPHSSDVPLKDVAELLLKVNVQAYSVEAGNVRHAHEWKVWRDVVKLPSDKVLIPGVVSHATNVLEHPELVADRLVQYAEVVGRENVIAGTDCGLGGRVHPQLAWAKLQALVEGAELATRQLWP